MEASDNSKSKRSGVSISRRKMLAGLLAAGVVCAVPGILLPAEAEAAPPNRPAGSGRENMHPGPGDNRSGGNSRPGGNSRSGGNSRPGSRSKSKSRSKTKHNSRNNKKKSVKRKQQQKRRTQQKHSARRDRRAHARGPQRRR